MDNYGIKRHYSGKVGQINRFKNMFIGEYIYSIDEKKRLAIPVKFRTLLGKKAVITIGLDNCLVIYPLKEWQKIAAKLESLPPGQVDARGYARFMLSRAIDVAFDKLGRILIPDYLKEYASFHKNVAVLGLSNRIEVWDQNKWQEYQKKTESTIGDMAERLKEWGI